MNLAIDYAGIPIALPAWVRVATYLFLALFGLAVVVSIWRGILRAKDRTQIGEIHAKVNIMLLIVRGWQERYEAETGSDPVVSNEHYAPDNLTSTTSGSTRAELTEVTDQHERLIK